MTVRETILAQNAAALAESKATLTYRRKITSHAGCYRFLAECSEEPVGTVPRQIRTHYASSPTHLVYNHPTLGNVVVAETSHKVYSIFTVAGPLGPMED